MRENLHCVSSVLAVCRDLELSSLGSSCDIDGIMQSLMVGAGERAGLARTPPRVPSVSGYGRKARPAT